MSSRSSQKCFVFQSGSTVFFRHRPRPYRRQCGEPKTKMTMYVRLFYCFSSKTSVGFGLQKNKKIIGRTRIRTRTLIGRFRTRSDYQQNQRNGPDFEGFRVYVLVSGWKTDSANGSVRLSPFHRKGRPVTVDFSGFPYIYVGDIGVGEQSKNRPKHRPKKHKRSVFRLTNSAGREVYRFSLPSTLKKKKKQCNAVLQNGPAPIIAQISRYTITEDHSK